MSLKFENLFSFNFFVLLQNYLCFSDLKNSEGHSKGSLLEMIRGLIQMHKKTIQCFFFLSSGSPLVYLNFGMLWFEVSLIHIWEIYCLSSQVLFLPVILNYL